MRLHTLLCFVVLGHAAACTAPEDVILVVPEPIGFASAPVPTPAPSGPADVAPRHDPVAATVGPGILLDLDDQIGLPPVADPAGEARRMRPGIDV